MTNPFWNSSELRIRAFWRILLQFALILLLGLVAEFVVPGIVRSPLESSLATLVVVTLATWIAARFLDRRRFRDLGLHLTPDWWLDLAFGLALGIALMGIIFLIEYALGWVIVTGTFVSWSPTQAFLPSLLSTLLVMICIGFYEELLSRGYHLTNLTEGLNLRRVGPGAAVLAAFFISSSMFGLAHAANPNASAISTFNIVLAGIMLGLPYVLTGKLAACIGLHITWNFAQGALFGFPVSGMESILEAQLIASDQAGPDLWTGGAFGPEAGLLGVFAMLLGVALISFYTRARYGHATLFLPLAQPPATSIEQRSAPTVQAAPPAAPIQNPESKI